LNRGCIGRGCPAPSHQLAPDFALVHQDLKRARVTLQGLWEQYVRCLIGAGQQAYKCTSFCGTGRGRSG